MRAGERAGELTQEQRCTTDAHLAGNHAGLEQLFRARVIAFFSEAQGAKIRVISPDHKSMHVITSPALKHAATIAVVEE